MAATTKNYGTIKHVAVGTRKAVRGKYRNWGPSDSLLDRWDAEMRLERAQLAAKKEEVKSRAK